MGDKETRRRFFIMRTSTEDQNMLKGLSQASDLTESEVVRRALRLVTVDSLQKAADKQD